MCRFIRSIREGDFPLYVQVCDELCSWFHALDHTNYARWLLVHVRDMVQLPFKHPELYSHRQKKLDTSLNRHKMKSIKDRIDLKIGSKAEIH